MKRRLFVKKSLLAGTFNSLLPLAGLAAASNNESKNDMQQFYELRVYTLKNEAQQTLVQNYLRDAFIPAVNGFGSNSIGVFTELKPAGQTKIFVLIPFKSLQNILDVQDKLSSNAAYNKAASAYLTAPATEPAYERIESSLMRAFKHMPQIEVPENKARIFELRRYESAGEMAAKKKIEMFNTQGEIDIFKRTGLKPVFFGETLIGSQSPNLTYMLCFDDMAAHDTHWKTFGTDAEWKKISSVPEYADAKIVSHITSTFLVPADFSQI